MPKFKDGKERPSDNLYAIARKMIVDGANPADVLETYTCTGTLSGSMSDVS